MMQVFEMIERAASADVPVLIVGETGTGKERVAQEIHARSGRRDGPFVAVNTGVLTEDLVASELFGHTKGAFTGALESRGGRFAEAKGGTLFLDEIATMSERIQVMFLRVLEEGSCRPVGAQQDTELDARVIAASNMDLRQAAEEGRFREDLLHRLTVFRIVMPPLREHIDDIEMLAAHFVAVASRDFNLKVTGVADQVLDVLKGYPWPGNVRELKNAVAQAAIMAGEGPILIEHVPPRITSFVPASVGAAAGSSATTFQSAPSVGVSSFPDPTLGNMTMPLGLRLADVEKAYVTKMLEVCANNKTQAAQVLGISRKTLHSWLAKWGVEEEGS